ncbi:glycosyltransferase [Paraglaciecola marina]|uniref:glycosyltransferase n=1 Tax=Paraglaciecola marina TaxID=2500157 RepID=UPI0010613733|nr:glycosyltransferase [Paraglaciecola marina]
MGDKKRLMLIQPVLTDYRIYFFNKFTENYSVKLFSDIAEASTGHDVYQKLKCEHVKTPRTIIRSLNVYFQRGLIQGFFKFKPNYIFITAHPKNITFWLLLLVAYFTKTKVFIHGQGFYNKRNPSKLLKLVYKIMFFFCDKYVCYTKSTKASLAQLPEWCLSKCMVAENSIFNQFDIPPDDKDYLQNGILYIGRIRDNCNLNLLAEAVVRINENNENNEKIFLHIIGAGEYEESLKSNFSRFDYIKFHGKIFEQEVVANLSKTCFLGCYPGQAGLSVVHYMSLSLPSLVHSDLTVHMGPEPSYIVNGFNGVTFDDFSLESITESILEIISLKASARYQVMGKNAYKTYLDLINPDYSEKLMEAFQNRVS